MASKPKAPTRTTRTRTPTIPMPPPSRTTRAANTRATPTPPLTESHTKKAPMRKPFVDRNASPEAKGRVGADKQMKSTFTKPAVNTYIPSDVDKEPIRAYLRIRPQMGDDDDTPHTNPYLEPISSTAVRMSDNSSTPRLSSPPAVYTFSHIFPPDTSQSDFFKHTTLPLVKDVLEGQSGLLFAYGVTNSGKTYTVQGGREEGSAGIIPRTLDVIFNSIEGLHGDGRFRPVRLQGIEAAPPTLSSSHSSTSLLHEPALADVLLDLPPTHLDPADTDPTTFKLDRNHEYTIWLSYAEVYNEKVYDLLASVDSGDGTSTDRPTSTFLNPSSQPKQPLLLTRKALPVKPSPPSDLLSSFSDDDLSGISGGKYVAGQRQIRVTSAAQAKALLRVGQMHRQVFGTLANARSSRSHAVVTVKVLRVHKGERNDPTSIQTSRLTLVDLAGSERTRNTHTTGDRLREAGNINKSLMVLGQCMETMRANQRSIARRDARGLGEGRGGDGGEGRYDTREAKKSLAVVPFRHSKLTEVLMDYFVGEGRVVMIVNVNPYDTGYDENSHVMKFSAIAREVATLPPTATSRPVSTIPTLPRTSKSSIGTRGSDGVVPHRRKVTISTGGPGVGETTLEVLEEDEEPGMEDEDNEPINPLVDALFDEIETLRMQLYESEMRSVIIEAQTREEVMTEMEERMKRMEGVYSRRLMQEIEQYEMKMDAKIEMLQRAGMAGNGNSQPRRGSRRSLAEVEDETITEEDEEDVSDDRTEDSEDADEGEEEDEDDSYGSEERSSSPLAGKNAPRVNGKSSLSSRSIYSLSSNADTADDDENAEEAIPQSNMFQNQALPTPPNSQAFEDDEDSSSLPLQKAKSKANARTKAAASTGRRSTRTTRTSSSSLANVVQKTAVMTLEEEDDDEDAVIIPNKKARQAAGPDVEYVPQAGESDTGKKKKRQLSKKPVVTEADIERTIGGGDGAQQSSRPRRSTRTGRA